MAGPDTLTQRGIRLESVGGSARIEVIRSGLPFAKAMARRRCVMSTEPQSKAKRNTQAIAGLILGVLSLVLALLYAVPGITGSLRCVSLPVSLLAVVAGVLGLRAARNLSGQGLIWHH